MNNGYILVIDTDSYSGNFNRELIAYTTGNGLSDDALGEIPDELIDEIDSKMNTGGGDFESMFPTPGWFNNGVGGEFRDGEDEKAKRHHDEYYKYKAKQIPEMCNAWSWPKESIDRELKSVTDQIGKLNKCAAFLSVGIYFTEMISDDLCDFIIYRAKEYLGMKGISYDGYRLFKVSMREIIRSRE